MFDKDKSLQDQYVDFMGTWTAGSLVGHMISKLLIPVLFVWGLYYIACN